MNTMIPKIFAIIRIGFYSAIFLSLGAQTAQADDAWDVITPSGTSGYSFNTIAAIDDYVYLGTDHGIYKSSNQGDTFTATNAGLTNLNVNSVAIGWTYNESAGAFEVTASSPVFVGTDSGLFLGTLGGSSWVASNTGLTNTNIKDIEVDQSNFTQVYVATPSAVFRSDDAGSTWSHVDSGISGKSITRLATDFNNLTIYAVTTSDELFSSDLFSNTGSDEDWSRVSIPGSPSLRNVSIVNARGSNAWLASGSGILKSDDTGTVWTAQNDGMGQKTVNTVASDYMETNIAYAATNGSGIYRMKDESAGMWFPLNKNLTDLTIKDVCTNPGNSSLVYSIGSNGAYRLILTDPYVDIDSPAASITLSDADGIVRSSDSLTITATFNEPVSDSPAVQIALTGANTLAATNMTKETTTRYSYVHTVGSGNGTVTISLSTGTDASGNTVNAPPWEGDTFTVDNTAPVRSGLAPSGSLAAGTTSTSLSVTTNENATCRYSTSAGTAYNSMTNTFSTTGSTSHSTTVSGLTNGNTYNYYVRCRDGANNANGSDATITFSVSSPSDTTAPVLSGLAPSGSLAAGTTSTSLSVTTNENATCRYSTSAGTAYNSMTNTFSTTGSTSHSTTVSGLTNGNTYNYYVRCRDGANNANGSDATIRFTVSNPTASTTAVYRFWSDEKQGHFYTVSEAEKNHIIANYPERVWKYEGIAYYAYSARQSGTSPIYRFWSDEKQGHFYTISEEEKNHIIANYPERVWKYEGIAYYAYSAPQSGTTAVYRFWSDEKQHHFFTNSEEEKNHIIANYPERVWKYEGIAYYVPNRSN